MDYKATKLCLLVVLSTCLWQCISAQSGCTSTLMGLSPCLKYVSGNSSTPSPSCCSQLTTVVQSQPQCLCLLLNGTASNYGFNINQTLALALPDACSVKTPPASRCDVAANGPTTSTDTQQNPPSDSSNTPVAGSNIPSGSKATPSQINGDKNNGSSTKSGPWSAPAFLVLIISYAVSVAGF